MITASRFPRPAATLILARDTDQGMQVLMVRRSTQADYAAGSYVFPGGTLEESDGAETILRHCDRQTTRDEQFALKFCAIRECFEEAGLLLAVDADNNPVGMETEQTILSYADARRSMLAGSMSFADLCDRHALRPATAELAYFSHWITPLGAPKRFDVHFFVAATPPHQTPSHDEAETIGHLWIRPEEAIGRQRRNEMGLLFPTIKTLEALACFETVAALLAHARTPRLVQPIQSRLATGRAGVRPVGPWEAAYAEIGKLDPNGKICASYEILPGAPVRLSQKILRITAPNGNFMTGPGTNSYFLGAGDEIALIDPGPASEAHLQALLEEAGTRLRWILVTHTHPDHSPAAALLRDKTGAELWGCPVVPGKYHDASFRADRLLSHGERLDIAGCALRVLHTPGHASNHLCYLLEDERVLFAGDHIMQGSTVVIDPPDGDMSAYMNSLKMLLHEDIAFIAPGHGFLMERPHEVIEKILLHRLARENKICNALYDLGEATEEIMLLLAYDDIHPRLQRFAVRSMLAHLIKLEREGRALHDGQTWRARPSVPL
ncbi:MAG: MBL fold metallo-hydrolase [Sterolibacterium sp.]